MWQNPSHIHRPEPDSDPESGDLQCTALTIALLDDHNRLNEPDVLKGQTHPYLSQAPGSCPFHSLVFCLSVSPFLQQSNTLSVRSLLNILSQACYIYTCY